MERTEKKTDDVILKRPERNRKIREVSRWVAFLVLLVLGVGYMPSRIGLLLLYMAALACPIQDVEEGINIMLEYWSERTPWFGILLLFLAVCDPEEFSAFGAAWQALFHAIFG